MFKTTGITASIIAFRSVNLKWPTQVGICTRAEKLFGEEYDFEMCVKKF